MIPPSPDHHKPSHHWRDLVKQWETETAALAAQRAVARANELAADQHRQDVKIEWLDYVQQHLDVPKSVAEQLYYDPFAASRICVYVDRFEWADHLRRHLPSMEGILEPEDLQLANETLTARWWPAPNGQARYWGSLGDSQTVKRDGVEHICSSVLRTSVCV
jgi:hypothetical protein